MTGVKMVVGVAVAAFLALNVVGAAVVIGGVSAFERVEDFAERISGDDDGFRDDFEREEDDDDGYVDDIEAPDFDDGFGPGFLGGKGKGAEGVAEMAYAVENASVGADEAEEVALGEVSGRIVETKLKSEGGFPHYEIEVYDGEGRLHEVLVGARDGEVVGKRVEDAEDSYEIGYLLDQANISRDEAEATATADFPGRVVENKLDDENGFPIWEVETFGEDGLLHEVKVNAQNGEILFYETKGSF